MLYGVSLLQFMEKAPDRKAHEHVKLHLGCKYALDLELDEPGFDHTTLVNFRQRGVQAGGQRIGFDALALIRWLRHQPARIRDHDQALLLERVFLEQYELSYDTLAVRKLKNRRGQDARRLPR